MGTLQSPQAAAETRLDTIDRELAQLAAMVPALPAIESARRRRIDVLLDERAVAAQRHTLARAGVG